MAQVLKTCGLLPSQVRILYPPLWYRTNPSISAGRFEKQRHMNILDSSAFKKIMYFKFFMVIFIWGLIPLLIPANLIPLLGLNLTNSQVTLLRIWGIIVLLDTFVYLYIYKNPHNKLSKYLILFAIIDNGGLGVAELILWPFFKFPWGIWINIPFQLFFGYWFWQFYRKGRFN